MRDNVLQGLRGDFRLTDWPSSLCAVRGGAAHNPVVSCPSRLCLINQGTVCSDCEVSGPVDCACCMPSVEQ